MANQKTTTPLIDSAFSGGGDDLTNQDSDLECRIEPEIVEIKSPNSANPYKNGAKSERKHSKVMKKELSEKQLEYIYKIRNMADFSSVSIFESNRASGKLQNVNNQPQDSLIVARNGNRLDQFEWKMSKELIHSGMAYSPERHGIVVVKKNSVNVSPIKVSATQNEDNQKIDE